MKNVTGANTLKISHSFKNQIKAIIIVFLLSFLYSSVNTSVVNAASAPGVKNVLTYVETYGNDIKESMIDHIIIEYDTPVKLPQSADKRKNLYSLKDTYYGGVRKVAAVYSNNKAETMSNQKSVKGKYVVIQFEKKQNPSYSADSYSRGEHGGNATLYDSKAKIQYHRYNFSNTMVLTQGSPLYSYNGRIVRNSGQIKLDDGKIIWDASLKKAEINNENYEGYTANMPYHYRYATKGQMGKITSISYKTKDYYKNDGVTITKKAMVYLPAEYSKNSSNRYPVLYYMHGTGGSAENTVKWLAYIMDNMIFDGRIEPMIVVFPTFYTNNPTKGRYLGAHNQDVFDKEFRNDLIRAVEGKFRTYAVDTTDTGLIASRDYRAFTGYSAGGFVTWQTFIDNADFVKNYIPLSGYCYGNNYDENGKPLSYRTIQLVIDNAKKIKEKGLDYRIIECCGDNDSNSHMTEGVKYQFDCFKQYPKLFSPKEYQILWTKGGEHNNYVFDDGLYSALPMLFPGENYK